MIRLGWGLGQWIRRVSFYRLFSSVCTDQRSSCDRVLCHLVARNSSCEPSILSLFFLCPQQHPSLRKPRDRGGAMWPSTRWQCSSSLGAKASPAFPVVEDALSAWCSATARSALTRWRSSPWSSGFYAGKSSSTDSGRRSWKLLNWRWANSPSYLWASEILTFSRRSQ